MEKSPGSGGKLSVREQLTRNREELAALISRTSSLRQRVSVRAASSVSPDLSADGSPKGSQKGSRRALADVVFCAPHDAQPVVAGVAQAPEPLVVAAAAPSPALEAENRWLKAECERLAAELKSERAAKAELEDDLAETVQVLRDVTAHHKLRGATAASDLSEMLAALEAEKRRVAHLEADNVRMAMKVNRLLEAISQAAALEDDADSEAQWKMENALLRSALNATQ